MIWWGLIGAFFLGSLGYYALPGGLQDVYGWNIGQALGLTLTLLVFVSINYATVYRKAAALILVLWQGWIFATDWLPGWSVRAGLIETGLFVAWTVYAARKIHAAQSD